MDDAEKITRVIKLLDDYYINAPNDIHDEKTAKLARTHLNAIDDIIQYGANISAKDGVITWT